MKDSTKFGQEAPLSRTPETETKYLAGGMQLLRRAVRLYPSAHNPAQALTMLFSDPATEYRSSTTRLYLQQIGAVLRGQARNGHISGPGAQLIFARFKVLLKARRGQPPARTSRKKVRDARPDERFKIRTDLARRARLDGLDLADQVLALLLTVLPFCGLRPVEFAAAVMKNATLYVQNAKASNGRAPGAERSISLADFPLPIVEGFRLLIPLFQQFLRAYEGDWPRALGVLSERLARICRRQKIRRLSMYSFRHVAIATWKRAGYSPGEIAALAGHSSIRTARRHYTPSRFGWSAHFACARPDPTLVRLIEQRRSPSPPPDLEEPPPAFAMR